jgi:hypothetical protein
MPCHELADWVQDILDTCGGPGGSGNICNTDQRKPGTIISGAEEWPSGEFTIYIEGKTFASNVRKLLMCM